MVSAMKRLHCRTRKAGVRRTTRENTFGKKGNCGSFKENHEISRKRPHFFAVVKEANKFLITLIFMEFRNMTTHASTKHATSEIIIFHEKGC